MGIHIGSTKFDVELTERLNMWKVRGRKGGETGRGCFVPTFSVSVALVAVGTRYYASLCLIGSTVVTQFNSMGPSFLW